MFLSRVLSRWDKLPGRPFDFLTKLKSSRCSFLVRLRLTRSRPFSTSQTETTQTIFQGTRFQMRLAVHHAMSTDLPVAPNGNLPGLLEHMHVVSGWARVRRSLEPLARS